MTDFSKVAAAMWRRLCDDQKAAYRRKYEMNKHHSKNSNEPLPKNDFMDILTFDCDT